MKSVTRRDKYRFHSQVVFPLPPGITVKAELPRRNIWSALRASSRWFAQGLRSRPSPTKSFPTALTDQFRLLAGQRSRRITKGSAFCGAIVQHSRRVVTRSLTAVSFAAGLALVSDSMPASVFAEGTQAAREIGNCHKQAI